METSYQLGPFRLDGEAQILFRGARPLALGERAVALLRVLVERAGAPVSKDALIEAAWPGVVVEESNLTVQVAALRRALGEEVGGERSIETLQRRGYRYVGPVSAAEGGSRVAAAMLASPAPALPERASVAVLPFANLSGDQDQEYFADGMVEDIITGLSRIKWLFVVARNSSFTYKGQAVNVKEVGRELGVRYLLEGSVRRGGTRVRIAAQLVEAETGAHVWAERYDRRFDDIFALQDEITLSVVGAIEPNLREAEITRIRRKRPDNLDAYDLVLRALPHAYVAMPEEVAKAMPLLGKALAIEPDYAGAHSWLALCHESLYVRAGFREEDRTAAIHHARAAITPGATTRRRSPSAHSSSRWWSTTVSPRSTPSSGRARSARPPPSRCSSAPSRSATPARRSGRSTGRRSRFASAPSTGWAIPPSRRSPSGTSCAAGIRRLRMRHVALSNRIQVSAFPQPARRAARQARADGRSQSGRHARPRTATVVQRRRVLAALAVPAALAEPLTSAWRDAGLPA